MLELQLAEAATELNRLRSENAALPVSQIESAHSDVAQGRSAADTVELKRVSSMPAKIFSRHALGPKSVVAATAIATTTAVSEDQAMVKPQSCFPHAHKKLLAGALIHPTNSRKLCLIYSCCTTQGLHCLPAPALAGLWKAASNIIVILHH